MKPVSIALLLAAGAMIAGCKSNESKPAESAPPPAATAAPAPAAPAAAKPECQPASAAKKKTTKKSSKKTEEAAPAECEPAPAAAPAAKPAPAAAASTAAPANATSGKNCNPCVVKSRDGSFDGEIYGNIPPGSRWAQLRIGMEQPEVERLIGVSHQVHAYPTAKAWVPFYYGTDRHRYEVSYPGYGSVSYTGGSWGGGRGVLMMINYDGK
ncbi:MAG: hypothetical protein H6R14_1987 [Proteobacteria bacterium]|nr:hypothetical protein [Pseudomonadota bacterium]